MEDELDVKKIGFTKFQRSLLIQLIEASIAEIEEVGVNTIQEASVKAELDNMLARLKLVDFRIQNSRLLQQLEEVEKTYDFFDSIREGGAMPDNMDLDGEIKE
jgi:hypothetical protein